MIDPSENDARLANRSSEPLGSPPEIQRRTFKQTECHAGFWPTPWRRWAKVALSDIAEYLAGCGSFGLRPAFPVTMSFCIRASLASHEQA